MRTGIITNTVSAARAVDVRWRTSRSPVRKTPWCVTTVTAMSFHLNVWPVGRL